MSHEIKGQYLKLGTPATYYITVEGHLDDALSKKITLISAPAGYGKTTLVAQWLDHPPNEKGRSQNGIF